VACSPTVTSPGRLHGAPPWPGTDAAIPHLHPPSHTAHEPFPRWLSRCSPDLSLSLPPETTTRYGSDHAVKQLTCREPFGTKSLPFPLLFLPASSTSVRSFDVRFDQLRFRATPAISGRGENKRPESAEGRMLGGAPSWIGRVRICICALVCYSSSTVCVGYAGGSGPTEAQHHAISSKFREFQILVLVHAHPHEPPSSLLVGRNDDNNDERSHRPVDARAPVSLCPVRRPRPSCRRPLRVRASRRQR